MRGRKGDYFYGKSIQNLPYKLDNFEPDFDNGYFLESNGAPVTVGTNDSIFTGYDFVQKYHIIKNNSNINNYQNMLLECLGIGGGQVLANDKDRDTNDLNGLPEKDDENAFNLWSSPGNRLGVYGKGKQPIRNASLILSGITKVHERDKSYFNLIQPYQHHTNIPPIGIYVYSFALDPEEHQPSGSCNFAKLDGLTIEMNLTENIQKNGPNNRSFIFTTNTHIKICYNIRHI